jgi:hypothetical protein
MSEKGPVDQSNEPEALLEAEAEMAESMRILASRKAETELAGPIAWLFLLAFVGVSLALAALLLVIGHAIGP